MENLPTPRLVAIQNNYKNPKNPMLPKNPKPQNKLATQRLKIHQNDGKPHHRHGKNQLHKQSKQTLTHNRHPNVAHNPKFRIP
jgi:hypothetical protein